MNRTDVSFWLSIAGFPVTVVLAVVKSIEFYNTRRIVLTADARLTTSDDLGNDIVLLNKSSVPVTIAYYEMIWVDHWKLLGWKIPFTSRIVRDETPLDPPMGYDVSMAPHETHTLSFRGDYHFEWGKDLAQDIYLRLWLVGRNSPIQLWITGPGRYK